MNHITRFVGLVSITAGTAFLGSLIEFEPPATQYGPELPTRGQIRAQRLADMGYDDTDSRLRESRRIEANQRNRFISQYRANCLNGRSTDLIIGVNGQRLGSYCLSMAQQAYSRSR